MSIYIENKKRMGKVYMLFSYVCSGLIAFFAPIYLLFNVITFLIGIDLLTGILKSIKTYDGPKGFWCKIRIIKSNKLRRSFVKWFLYVIFIMCVYALETALGLNFCLYLAQLAFAMLAFVELYSIGENMDVITGKKGIFISIISKIRKLTEDKVNNSISGKEN